MKLHDEFESLFVDQKQGDGLEPGPEMNPFIYQNHSDIFFALREFEMRREAKAAAIAALTAARDAIQNSLDAFKPPK